MDLVDCAQASRIRREIRQLQDEMELLLKEIMQREPLVKGTLYSRKRQCGRVGCRCGQGELHESEAFSRSVAGKTRHMALSDLDQTRLRDHVCRYRRFRAARARLSKKWLALMEKVNTMEAIRTMPVDALLMACKTDEKGA